MNSFVELSARVTRAFAAFAEQGRGRVAGAINGGLLWLGRLSQTADVKTMLIWSVAILLVGQVVTAVASWGVGAALTRKTLKAIELLSRQ